MLDAGQQELESEGLSSTTATLIRLVKELSGAYLAENLLSSPQAAVEFARVKLAGLPHEALMVIYLNIKNVAIPSPRRTTGSSPRPLPWPPGRSTSSS